MEKKPTMLIVVAAALVDQQGRALLQKRPENKDMGGLWEFPGGKVDETESPTAALVRELREELGIDASPDNLDPLTFASAGMSNGGEMLLLLYVCRQWKEDIAPLEGQPLEWVCPAQMYNMRMPPADAPFIPILADYLKRIQKPD